MDEDRSTHVQRKSVTAAMDRVVLTVLEGPDRDAVAVLPIGSARVGTSIGCHLVLTDATVSRIHCEVRVSRAGIRLIDLESTNGCVIDGVRVYDAELAPASIVRLGGTVLRVDIERGKAIVELAPLARFGPLVGSSPEMRAIYASIPRIASSLATTLIQGETGTGKEVVASAIHQMSPRATKPFVVFDCAGISAGVVESDLFGHVRGAFTGAETDRPGLFEVARGGTLFIDEISDLPLALQPRLLRVLEARQVRRMGSNKTIDVDVHVVAASRGALLDRVNEGTFREDLFYRLAVAELFVPPLRARGDDAAELAHFFWERFAPAGHPLPIQILREARTRRWPGNVRELRNLVERVAKLGLDSLPANSVSSSSPAHLLDGLADLPLREARKLHAARFEEAYAEAVLSRTGGNVTRAAELAQVNRRSFQRMLAKEGLAEDAEDAEGD